MSAKTKVPKYQKNILLKTENAFDILNEPDEEEMVDEEPQNSFQEPQNSFQEPQNSFQEPHHHEENENQKDFPHGKYDLFYKTVDIDGIQYQYDNEYLFSGQESLNPVVIDVMNEEPQNYYPQGVNYCKQIIAEQQANGRMFVILTKNDKKNTIHFIFPINTLLDLQLYQVKCHFLFDMEKINQHLRALETEFKDDVFPQGKNNYMSLLKEKIDSYGIHSIIRYTNESRVHYYFRYKFNPDIPKEKIRFFGDEMRYDELSKLINKNPETFPHGKEYCSNAVKNAIENDSAIFVVGNNEETRNFLLIDDEIEQVCEKNWWPINLKKERRLINIRKTTECYPQGLKYVFDLIQKQQENGGRVRVLKLASPETVWFYIKGKSDLKIINSY